MASAETHSWLAQGNAFLHDRCLQESCHPCLLEKGGRYNKWQFCWCCRPLVYRHGLMTWWYCKYEHVAYQPTSSSSFSSPATLLGILLWLWQWHRRTSIGVLCRGTRNTMSEENLGCHADAGGRESGACNWDLRLYNIRTWGQFSLFSVYCTWGAWCDARGTWSWVMYVGRGLGWCTWDEVSVDA